MVSEPRLLLTVEKERQVFVFERAMVFSRRVELGQAKFKYEYKFKMMVRYCPSVFSCECILFACLPISAHVGCTSD